MFRLVYRVFRLPSRIFLWLVLLGAALVITMYLNRSDVSAFLAAHDKRNALRDEKERLENEVRRLEREREVLARGGFEVERVARERFRMSKPGETILHVESVATAPTTSTVPAPQVRPARPARGRRTSGVRAAAPETPKP